jgi:excisionase family DNA binding protein
MEKITTKEVDDKITMTMSREFLDDDALRDLLRNALLADQTERSKAGLIDPYLTASQAANYMACDKRRIYDLTSSGRLRYVKDGSRLLIRQSWIDSYLESCAVG